MKCLFATYSLRCVLEAVPGDRYCADHTDLRCCSCDAKATHGCGEGLQFVCGYPLCDNCHHNHGAGRGHVRREVA